MDRARWQTWIFEGVEKPLGTRTLACFNANVDVVAHLEPSVVHNLLQAVTEEFGPLPEVAPNATSVRSVGEFLSLLKESLAQGKSTYAVLEDLSVLGWFDRFFSDARRAMGGQAGIIGNQMAALGAHSTVYVPALAPAQADMFRPEVKVPVVREGRLELVPAREAASPDDVLKVNWIFEYAAGLDFDFGTETVRTPRANRVIIATRPAGLEMSFCGEVCECIDELGRKADVAFMAGYHYAKPEDFEEYLAKVTAQLETLGAGNPDLRIHYEYVPAKHASIETTLLREICSRVNSFGINEHEIVRVLSLFGLEDAARAIDDDESAVSLYRGALALLRKLGVERIQLHNLGYYVIVLSKPYGTAPQLVREAALYGSTVNAAKAKYGGVVDVDQVQSMREWPLSDIGFTQLEKFAASDEVRAALKQVDEGIWEAEDHWALVVPAHVVPDPVSTVGMGDTISSSSYAREVQLGALVAPHV